ncbi:DNA polymerase III subunit gamma/tau [Candidatus Dependentiae bacterium]|nr:DNA polymerase III subunit gamma/tau [Candidatus Dependentiae bacterium]
MEQSKLNLTRKWRSKKFKEIVGQDFVLKILQNSLYKKTFFPVYLFSGQRGCGKTTTARVFAAAMNCENLLQFQNNPKLYQIPCLQCVSCQAMNQMRHPDFIEIDAASYTGIDNIRNIIDTSSFLPVLSSRKIYLIDEVHMLSKAAFNAFLKILEEPPKFVVFILATTEIQKIPETVKSRCFQLFFNQVASSNVIEHLQMICEQEHILYDGAALELIAQSCDGSLRDAINLLEQARFAQDSVTKEAVGTILGYVQDQVIYDMIITLLEKKEKELLALLDQVPKNSISVDYLIKRLQQIVYDLILLKYEMVPKYFAEVSDSLKIIIEKREVKDLMILFEELILLDELLAKTGNKQLVFETKLLSTIIMQHHEQEAAKKKIESKNDQNVAVKENAQWKSFLISVEKKIDPVLYAILVNSWIVSCDVEKKVIYIQVLKKFAFFQDLFFSEKKNYQSDLEFFFGEKISLSVDFCHESERKVVEFKKDEIEKARPVELGMIKKIDVEKIDISDKKKWQLTHALLKHFGGIVTQEGKDTYESNA